MSIYELFHYSLFPGLFIAFTYNKKQPPAFGAAPAFWCILLSFLGLLFCHIPNNLSNYNVLTANAPFFYQISGTWSNHEGSILLWCRILSFYGFLLCYRGRSQSHNVSKRGGHRESLLFSFVLNFFTNSIRTLPRYELQSRVLHEPQLYTLFVLRTEVDSELCSRRNRTKPALFYAPLYPERKMSFALLGASRSRGSREGKRTHPLLHLARDDKERASSIDEQRIDGALGIAFNRSLLMLLRRRFFAFSSLWTRALVDTGRERAKPFFRNGKKETTTSPLCWTAGANTVVSDQDQEPIRIWILTCRWFLTVGILPGSWWAHHELGRGGWWFRDPVENASFMPRVLATARIHSVILPLLHSWTLLLSIVTFLCCVLGTFSIRSGLLAPVHSFATDDTRGIFLWRFFLLMTGISMILFSQMKQQASVRRTYKKEMVVARSTEVHLRHLARAQPRPLMLWKN
ncbi:hypothetical protein Cgig2_015028 [Carnegiea gigantea]|uniref:Cytochrome c assembly protein domain-containing protein n=1 Tax=Carnegiea gigantea TaxID=171969 RepID=A0A9Q1GWA6_9CARY|nr:hypothetical protein Cgig2_015028 [Carnegiea gigantea]